jgi:hypothetical protein
MSIFKSYIKKMQISYEEFCKKQNPEDYVSTRYEEDGSFSIIFLYEKFCNDNGVKLERSGFERFGKEISITIQEPNKLIVFNGIRHDVPETGERYPFDEPNLLDFTIGPFFEAWEECGWEEKRDWIERRNQFNNVPIWDYFRKLLIEHLDKDIFKEAQNLLCDDFSAYNFLAADARILQLAKSAPGAAEILYIVTNEGADIFSERMAAEKLDKLLSLRLKPLLERLVNKIEGSLISRLQEKCYDEYWDEHPEVAIEKREEKPEMEIEIENAKLPIVINDAIVVWSKKGTLKKAGLCFFESIGLQNSTATGLENWEDWGDPGSSVGKFLEMIGKCPAKLIANLNSSEIERLLGRMVKSWRSDPEILEILPKIILRNPRETQMVIDEILAFQKEDYTEEEDTEKGWAESLFYQVADWLSMKVENEENKKLLDTVSFGRAWQKSQEWEQQLQEAKSKEAERLLAMTFPKAPFSNLKIESYNLEYLSDGTQLFEEGVEMKHCVFSYSENCNNGDYFVYSLRNQKEEKIATIQLNKEGEVVQFFGKQNHPIKENIKNMVCNAIERELNKTKKTELSLC